MSHGGADQPHESIVLGDGRRLSFAQYGDPRGSLLFYFHGMPGSRLEGIVVDEAARECGFRIVAPDRPGMGESDFKHGRTLLGWAADVAELADHLGEQRFGVAGASGGGPYVLAVAHALAERLDFAADLAGWGPVEEAEAHGEFDGTERALFWLADHVPILARLAFMALARAARRSDGYWKTMNRRISDADRVLLADPAVTGFMAANQCESFRQGARGPTLDALLIYREWGFRPEQIGVPVHFFHGTEDPIVPFAFSRYLAGTVPGATLTPYEGEGHLCLLKRAGEVVRFLAREYLRA
ncbi:MAG: alpha/beta fold hydrolase [Candidatus Binataceae bacterium]